MQIVIERFNGNLSVGPWTILNRVTPLLFSDPVPDADQTAFLAAYAVHCQYLPPRAHVLPLILHRTYPERPLSPQLPELPRVMTANTAATPGARVLRRSFLPIRTGIFPLLNLVHPAASATTNPVNDWPKSKTKRLAKKAFDTIHEYCVILDSVWTYCAILENTEHMNNVFYKIFPSFTYHTTNPGP